MAFCNKCGIELTDDDVFCPKCGNKIEIEKSEVKTPEAETAERPSMTKEESIALATKLAKEYGSLEKLSQEISEAEAIIKRPLPETPRHAAFKFFWPFLIIGAIIYIVVYLVVGVAFAAGGGYEMSTGVASIAAFLALAATLAIGGGVAKNRRDEMNNQEAMRMHTLRGKMDEMKKKTATLKTRYSTQKRELAQYDAIVPVTHRNKQQMERVKILLESGKADNIYDAIKL